MKRQSLESAVDLAVVLTSCVVVVIWLLLCIFFSRKSSATVRTETQLQQSVYERASKIFGRLFQSPAPDIWNELSERGILSPDPHRKLDFASHAFDLTQSTHLLYSGTALQNHTVTRGTHAEYCFSSEVEDYLDSVRKAQELRGPAVLPTIKESKSRESLISRQLHSFSSKESQEELRAVQVPPPREIVVFTAVQTSDREWLLDLNDSAVEDDLRLNHHISTTAKDSISCDDDEDYLTLENIARRNIPQVHFQLATS